MDVEDRIARLRTLLLHRGALQLHLGSVARLRTEVGQGRWVRVTRGWYVEAAEWRPMSVVDRHLVLALCAEGSALAAPVFSHVTAALLHGLPVLGLSPYRVHALQQGPRAASTTRVLIHRSDVPSGGLSTVAGLFCTDPVRTLMDLARSTPFETGLVAVEHALHLATTRDAPGWACHPEVLNHALREDAKAASPASGSARARRVLSFASSRSESPLESLNRLQLERLGFTVRQQVPVMGSSGRTYRIDAELEGYGVFVEADGRAKYRDLEMQGGRSVDEALLLERERENDVQGVTGYRIVRVMWEHVQTPEALGSRLRAFGIDPPRTSSKRLLELM